MISYTVFGLYKYVDRMVDLAFGEVAAVIWSVGDAGGEFFYLFHLIKKVVWLCLKE